MDSWSEHEGEYRLRKARFELIGKIIGALFAVIVYTVLKLLGVF